MTTQNLILGEGTKYPLKAKLTLPDQICSPVPAVVFVHGSGSSNMDEKVGKLTPFKDLAEGLADQGIASLRYDKRSFAHPFRMLREEVTVKEETMEDAILAAQLLRRTPGIDPDRIFLVGHSMGAMLAPRIDAEGGDFRGLILMAGSPRNLEVILLEQFRDMMDHSGKLAGMILKNQLKKLEKTFDGMYDLTDREAKTRKIGNGVTLFYFKDMGDHPVSRYLEKLEKPILVMQGGKDFQVKVREDYAMYQTLLEGRPNAAFRLYDNLNHCFVPSVYGLITKAKQEYNVAQHVAPEVIRDMAHWIHAN